MLLNYAAPTMLPNSPILCYLTSMLPRIPDSCIPAALTPAGMAKAAWTVAVPLARFAYRLLVWSSPVLIW